MIIESVTVTDAEELSRKTSMYSFSICASGMRDQVDFTGHK